MHCFVPYDGVSLLLVERIALWVLLGTAGAVTFDDDGVEVKLPGADGGDVAARSSAYYQDLAIACHGYMKMVAGCSSICFSVCIIWAPL